MDGLAGVAIQALEPLVGPLAASTCVRATALSMGKTADDLTAADLPTLIASVKRLLGPIAPASMIDKVVADIEKEVR